jgi:hypothetical protein
VLAFEERRGAFGAGQAQGEVLAEAPHAVVPAAVHEPQFAAGEVGEPVAEQ